ncbi:DUF6980 family protein [Kitasatospora sp. NPDC048365]|uniref:DUF6980 family protein n=1 Tax=Kitasatospora sp. NPDC048365 TaxID=3364050 RepID=UPI0037219202
MSVEHCCERMTSQVEHWCDEHDDPYDCPDALVAYSAKFREYGLPVRDGGTSRVGIAFCPWCGHALPPSQRDRWFAELEKLGIDPWEDELPDGFEDGRWLNSPAGTGS